MRASVIRYLHTVGKDEDWQRSILFYTYVVHEGKNYKVITEETVVSTSSSRQLCRHYRQDSY